MSEGPVSFGKPVLFLILAGLGGGGYWAYNNWPVHYEGTGWEIDFPNKWEANPFNDPTSPGKVVATGPLVEEGMTGVAWVTINMHGTLAWPDFVLQKLPGTPDKTEETEIAHKKSLMFEYEDNNIRYIGSAIQRGDAVIISAIGCAKHLFPTNKERFEKCVKSVRVNR
jgi:hypothetical protein